MPPAPAFAAEGVGDGVPALAQMAEPQPQHAGVSRSRRPAQHARNRSALFSRELHLQHQGSEKSRLAVSRRALPQ